MAVRGFSLVEMLVSVMILGILAVVALPQYQNQVRREKEQDLREALRTVRTAIDAFHEDWKQGRIPPGGLASENGYPVSLAVLVNGVDAGTLEGGRRYYLRRVPRNPFADPTLPNLEQWQLRSYQDEPDNSRWGRQDVYDIRVAIEESALDGSCYCDW
ncbi:type IV pilin protein [Alcanivorax sediminis]|uniref:Prepilin-type N-terminal cleavage/methylation domain-containing protein n=1 Tax=Alcanivorax sediminis TaxID=2663008 RepID=A0A6N7LS80_9GAMM|nr:type II secretion system protein [Alcanivorax sediminis]MQX53279.1 prepilin-type N-terminal cleavage/methylation domain-containing protein [Alcanivorax sediminis]